MTAELDDFARGLAEALGLDGPDIDIPAILSLASDAAHAHIRPAAPLATFLAGVAAGTSGWTRESMTDSVARAKDFCSRLSENQA